MNFKTPSSPIYVCVLSWTCAFTVLVVAFWMARFAFHRLPVFAFLGLTGFKYASMFYVAGRLIEQVWCSVSKVATRILLSTSDSEVSHG
jgi:hypothetical protein